MSVEKCAEMCKKVVKSFGNSENLCNFVAMKEHQYVITGISTLTGFREEISRPMGEDEARVRLERELESRKRHRHPAYKRLRVERRLPVQLTINFNEYE